MSKFTCRLHRFFQFRCWVTMAVLAGILSGCWHNGDPAADTLTPAQTKQPSAAAETLSASDSATAGLAIAGIWLNGAAATADYSLDIPGLDGIRLSSLSTVEQEREGREYKLNQPLWFSSSRFDVVLYFHLSADQTREGYTLAELYSATEASLLKPDGSKEPIAVERQDRITDAVQSIRLLFREAPKGKVAIRLSGGGATEEERTLELIMNYTEPFTYRFVTDDPELQTALESGEDGFGNPYPHFVEAGTEITYRIAFSKPPDRESVRQVLNQNLPDEQWRDSWPDEQTLELIFQLHPERYQYSFPLTLARITDRQGYLMTDSGPRLTIKPALRKTFYEVDTQTGQQTRMFETLNDYIHMQVSPNGKWIIAQETEFSEESLRRYSIREASGSHRAIKRFNQQEADYIQWLPDGERMVYVEETDRLVVYNLETDSKTVLWEAPREKADQPDSWIVPHVDAAGRIDALVMNVKGDFDYTFAFQADLLAFSDAEDSSPKTASAFQQGLCELLRCSYPFLALDEDHAVYVEQVKQTDRGGQPVYRLLDRRTMETRPLPSLTGKNFIGATPDGSMLIQQEDESGSLYHYTIFDPRTGEEKPLVQSNPFYSGRGGYMTAPRKLFSPDGLQVYLNSWEDWSWKLVHLDTAARTPAPHIPVSQWGNKLYVYTTKYL